MGTRAKINWRFSGSGHSVRTTIQPCLEYMIIKRVHEDGMLLEPELAPLKSIENQNGKGREHNRAIDAAQREAFSATRDQVGPMLRLTPKAVGMR
jgi:hypothetical protein